MAYFDHSTFLDDVECRAYGVAQDVYNYTYGFAQSLDDLVDSFIPRLPGAEAQLLDVGLNYVNDLVARRYGIDHLAQLRDTPFGQGMQRFGEDFRNDALDFGDAVLDGVGDFGNAAGDWINYRYEEDL